MSVGEVLQAAAAVLCCLALVALAVVLVRLLDALRAVREELRVVRAEAVPLLAELREAAAAAHGAAAEARRDLDRFDRVLGSAEAISGAVSGSGRMARSALSAPMIKTAAIATGTSRAVRTLRRSERRPA